MNDVQATDSKLQIFYSTEPLLWRKASELTEISARPERRLPFLVAGFYPSHRILASGNYTAPTRKLVFRLPFAPRYTKDSSDPLRHRL